MSDLDLGMNNWMSEPFDYPEQPIDRGKVLSAEDLETTGRLRALQGRGRRRRRLPHAARHRPSRGGLLHARQRPQREGPVQRAPRRLRAQHGPARAQVRRPCAPACRAPRWSTSKARGSASSPTARRTRRAREPRPAARRSTASTSSYLRPRAYPFTDDLVEFIRRHERVYVVDQNRDAQMLRADAAGDGARTTSRSCAASATTTGCRSTRAPSPTKSCAQEGK